MSPVRVSGVVEQQHFIQCDGAVYSVSGAPTPSGYGTSKHSVKQWLSLIEENMG